MTDNASDQGFGTHLKSTNKENWVASEIGLCGKKNYLELYQRSPRNAIFVLLSISSLKGE